MVSVGFMHSAPTGRSKISIWIGVVEGEVPRVARSALLAAVDAAGLVTAADVAVDRGHKHSDGSSAVSIWIQHRSTAERGKGESSSVPMDVPAGCEAAMADDVGVSAAALPCGSMAAMADDVGVSVAAMPSIGVGKLVACGSQAAMADDVGVSVAALLSIGVGKRVHAFEDPAGVFGTVVQCIGAGTRVRYVVEHKRSSGVEQFTYFDDEIELVDGGVARSAAAQVARSEATQAPPFRLIFKKPKGKTDVLLQ